MINPANSLQAADILLGLRDRIPGMSCIPGCTACCAHVPWSKIEWDRLPDEFKEKHTVHSLKCPFSSESEGCLCHDERPITCRLFGVAESLPCPRGAKPTDSILTERETADIYQQYSKSFEVDHAESTP